MIGFIFLYTKKLQTFPCLALQMMPFLFSALLDV